MTASKIMFLPAVKLNAHGQHS